MAKKIFRSGWTQVIVDINTGDFTSPLAVLDELLTGTVIETETETVDMADGRTASAGKRANVTILSANLDDAVLDPIREAEEDIDRLAFKFVGIRPNQAIIVRNVSPQVNLVPGEVGQLGAIQITGSGFALSDDELFEIEIGS